MYPLIPGHEIGGTVVAIGSEVSRDLEGHFVVVDPVVACGYCSDCRAGQTNLCRNWEGYGVTLPGGFADYIRIRAVDAEVVPSSVPRHWATLAEPLSCVLHALDRLGSVGPGDSVLVIGAGPTGLMLCQLLTAAGAIVDVVERAEGRRHRALNFRARRVGAVTVELEQSEGWDVVIEASGSVSGFESGLAAVRRAGRFHVFGVSGPDARATVSPYDIFARELTITGSQSLQRTLHRAMRLLSEGLLDGRKLLKGLRYVPRVIVTDKLASYQVAAHELVPSVTHRRSKYLNRAENSHQPTRVRKRVMKRCASPRQAQRFLFAFGSIRQHFRPRRHLISAPHGEPR